MTEVREGDVWKECMLWTEVELTIERLEVVEALDCCCGDHGSCLCL